MSMMWSRAFLTSITFGLFLPTQSKDEQDWTGIVLLGKMSESTLSAWSLSIHVPRGGGVGGPFRSLSDLQYWRTSSRKCII